MESNKRLKSDAHLTAYDIGENTVFKGYSDGRLTMTNYVETIECEHKHTDGPILGFKIRKQCLYVLMPHRIFVVDDQFSKIETIAKPTESTFTAFTLIELDGCRLGLFAGQENGQVHFCCGPERDGRLLAQGEPDISRHHEDTEVVGFYLDSDYDRMIVFHKSGKSYNFNFSPYL